MNTKQMFADSLESLLKQKNLDDIQVSEIVEGTFLSRKTFYRHFQDKYDLAAWYFSQLFEASFGCITSGQDWREALLKYLDLYEDRAGVLINAYKSRDINGLRNIDISYTRRTYENYLILKGADLGSEAMQFAIEIASRGGTDMVIEWLLGGRKMDKVKLVDYLKQTLPYDILKYID